MGLKEDLTNLSEEIWKNKWTVEKSQGVPYPEQLRLDNHAKYLESATVMYADLDGSTNMVDTRVWEFSAKVYKAYLWCAARIIRSESGEITAYDGDRIMAIFVGDRKETRAMRAAMKLKYAVVEILNPGWRRYYQGDDFEIRQVIGLDTSPLHAARTGVRGANDIVWVGPAANHAAKLTEDNSRPIWATFDTHYHADNDVKIHYDTKKDMWQALPWVGGRMAFKYGTTFGYVI